MAGTPKPIGRILIIPKGNYDPATPYNSLDLVRYDSKSWLCKTDGIIGITPTEGTDWTLMTEDGTDGTDGRGIVNIQRTGTDPSNPLKDIYTITYTDGTTSTFTVTNGSGGGTTADTMLKSVYDKDDDGIVDKADAANTATNATDATNAKNLKKSDGTTISADSINTKLSKVDTTDNLSVELAKKIDKPTGIAQGKVATADGNGGVTWEDAGSSIEEPTTLEKGIIGTDDNSWISGKAYAVKDVCIYNNKVYACINAHTSSASILPTNTTYWKVISLKSLNENSGTGKDIYTTDEQEIGTWVDGKPIYRCMWYSDNCNHSSEFKISSAITRQNVDTLIKGMGAIDDGTNYQPLNRSGYYNGEVAVYPTLRNDGLYMFIAQSNVKRYVLILEYTKK